MALTRLTIGLSEEAVEYIKKKGLNVVIRQLEGKAKGQILKHEKAVILDDTDNQTIQDVRRMMKDIGKNMNVVSDTMKNMSANVDAIFNNVKAVQGLSYLNAGLNIANLAVDAVGFVIIAQKIDALSTKVDSISRQLEKLQNLAEGEIQKQFQIYKSQFNKFVQKVHDNDPVDSDEVYDLLSEMHAFIHMIIGYYGNQAIDPEDILYMLTVLLPMYTSLLNMYVTSYFEDKEKLPETFDSFLDVYQKLISNQFGQTTFDYYFLDRNYNRNDARDIANANLLLAINNYTQISDRLELLKNLKTRDNYHQYRINLENVTLEQAEEELGLKQASQMS